MDNRRWLWIGASLLAVGGLYWSVGQAVGPGNGDVEFQKTLAALKQVKSFRGTYNESTPGTSRSERTWEMDCNQVIIHQQSHASQANTDSPFEMNSDELLVGELRYTRDHDGAWTNNGRAGDPIGDRGSAKWYCHNLEQGTVNDLLPDVLTMTRHGVFEKGDKKTVNGVRCREWKVGIRTALSAQAGSICLGVDDHLPYEMTDGSGHYTFSDYNQAIQFDAPEAVLQTASAVGGSN